MTIITEAKKGEMAEKDEIFRESLPTLEIRFDWMSRFMEESNPYAGLSSIKEWLEEVELLVGNLEQGKPALFPVSALNARATTKANKTANTTKDNGDDHRRCQHQPQRPGRDIHDGDAPVPFGRLFDDR